MSWNGLNHISSKQFKCGHCSQFVASDKGWSTNDKAAYIYVCSHCQNPTLFHEQLQIPGIVFGSDVADIDDIEVNSLYQEARKCTSDGAFTAAVLCCRKLLMHVAVAKGAQADKSFIEYVQFLADKNYIPPDAKDWVDLIRQKGNEANHEISMMKSDDAKDLIDFSGMLLTLIYEFPAAIKKKRTTEL
jgi:hypothetical protein